MFDWAKNWILQNILDAIAEMLQQFIDLFGEMIENIFGSVMEFNNHYLDRIDTFTTVFAIALIIFMIVKQYLTVYVLETSGDPEADPLDVYVRGAQAVAVASCSGIIFDFFLEFSNAFVGDLQDIDIGGSGASSTGMADTLKEMLSIPANFKNVPTVMLLIAVTMVIALIVFFIMAGIRGAELLLMKMLFPIFACDLVTTNKERFNAFFTSFIITWLAYGIQLISFKMFNTTLLLYITCDITEFPTVFASNIGWMVLMFKAPKWLEKFCYSSGIGNTMTGALRTLPFIIRHK